MYKLLILDYGGVYSFDYVIDNFNKIMAKTFGKIPNEMQKQAIFKISRLLAADKITTIDYIVQVGKILSVTALPREAEFEEATIEVTSPPSTEMVELVKRVQEAGIKVSLLSDMFMFEVNKTRPWGRYNGFDYVSFSAEIGMTKADPLFFRNTLKNFELAPREVLFVDDVLSHIEVAKSVGINVLHADKQKYLKPESLVSDIYERLRIEN